MKKTLIVAAVAASFATAANAQSSVTLYGLIDAGFTYVNNEVTTRADKGSAPAFRLSSGNINGSRWGLRGAEDLGGGMKAIFTLESGFSMGDGSSLQGGREFGRQAYAGISTAQFGTVTLGRQYDSVVDYLGPMTANGSWGGTYFSHPFDNDNTNNSFRVNNAVKYQSANYSGLTFGGLYGFSNEAGGFADNRAYSAGMQYANGPFKIAAAYLQMQNSSGKLATANTTSNTAGAVTESFLPSQTQRTYGVGANYAIGPVTLGGAWTQSRFQFVGGDSTVRFNNYELNARYALTPALAVGAAYTYTDVKGYLPTADNNDHARFHQVGLQTDYALSKRTDIYAEGVVQLAKNGAAAQVFGSNAPAAHGNQVVVSTGLRHRF
ncbi:outer membrane protein, (porin) [Caballeronia sordidicola]|uniref:Outer membrane protein, (Porin) n=1 Tax=Caballeronia sordidicola TaxID=196367 RepID=A0A158F4A0_CABSO|nr:porin [Caballeronia sordidicola]SAL14698.1 outer membrane protein, (porin) [Caballeronia sordidicola]